MGVLRYVSFSLVVILMLEGLLVPTHAAYERPVTWADMSNIDLRPVFRSQYASKGNLLDPMIPSSAMEIAMNDVDQRIADQFAIPASLRNSVGFWMKIYTEYSTQHIVIFDAQHQEIVYEVLDLRKLADVARNNIAYEIMSKRFIQRKMSAYRLGFARLASKKRPRKLSPEEQNILQAIRQSKHKHPLSVLGRNLRSQTGQRDNIIKGLLAAESFFPKMELIFSQMGLPPEITRLSLVESSFNLSAISRVGAAGIWQFMPASAKEYMMVNHDARIDERLSPLKSTVAAAKLLKRNYEMLGSWPLAITAYNHGYRHLPRLRGKNRGMMRDYGIFVHCPRKGRLGWASRNYYSEFLAVLHAEAYRHLFYGEPPAPSIRALALHQIDQPMSSVAFSMRTGVSIQEFRFLNPDIRDIHRPLPKGFWIAIPSPDGVDDLAALTQPRLGKVKVGKVKVSKVRRGLPRRAKT